VPQPRRSPPPEPPSSGLGPAAAAGVAAASPYAGASVAPAVAATAAVAGLGAGTALTVGGLIEALERFAKMRYASAEVFVFDELRREHPEQPAGVLRQIVEQEHAFEAEFRKRMRERLQRDLPKAFAISDPERRMEEIRKLFDREKQFTLMREEAMLLRALGKVEARPARGGVSRDGAYWKLSPYVKPSTRSSVSRWAEKFWPWERAQRASSRRCITAAQCYLTEPR
jgi:hypothetical protein